MQGYQFCHVETWSVAGSTGSLHHESGKRANGQKAWTVSQILDEAERRPGSAFHVGLRGDRPEILPGAVEDFEELRAAHAAAASIRESFDYTDQKTGTKSKRSRALRKDARSLYTCVFSLPFEMTEVDADPANREYRRALLAEAIAHERDRIERAAGTFMMAVLHWDESHPHVHFFALDPERGRVNHLHPGVAAKEAFAGNPRNSALSKKHRNSGGNRAYCNAMRAWQTDLHEEVFKHAGLLRAGPRRERLARADYLHAKQAAAERAEDRERRTVLAERSADRSDRRKTLQITVERTGSLSIVAPSKAEDRQLIDFVEEKLLWIHTKIEEKARLQQRTPIKKFVDGEGFLYLGKSYRLRLMEKQLVDLSLRNGRFCLRKVSSHRGREIFVDWYTRRAQEWFERQVAEQANRMGVTVNEVKVQDLGYRWGSFGTGGRVSFHWKAILLPPRIAQYIVIHELEARNNPPLSWLVVIH